VVAWVAPGFADTLVIDLPESVYNNPISTPTPIVTVEPTEAPVVFTEEEIEVRDVISAYFETRYRTFTSLQMDGFEKRIANSPEGESFLQAESGKLEVQLKYAELFRLRYIDYEILLDFTDISIDSSEQAATVSVIEGHDVIFEISQDYYPLDPIVSGMRNLEHEIVLVKEQGEWKIVSDLYEDYLWGFLRATGVSTDELLSYAGSPGSGPGSGKPSGETECNLEDDDTTQPYDRTGAVNYAIVYAYYYNDNYHDFSYDGGDCTNYVNQAIHEGGNAPMVGYDTYGWYYIDDLDHSASWTNVGKLFEIITDYDEWLLGPEGCEMLDERYVEEGDVIQYDWQGVGGELDWDHSVIIVQTEELSPHITDHWIASHGVGPEEDKLFYPYMSYVIPHEDMILRFIHIERIDTPEIDISISQGSDDAGTIPSDCAFHPIANEVYLGGCDDGGNVTSGFRFENVDIPKDATIKSAYIRFTVDGYYTGLKHVQIRGEVIESPSTYSLDSTPKDREALTDASVIWTIKDDWNYFTQRNTPDIRSIIQEIVNQEYWESSQPISIIFTNADPGSTSHRRVVGYEREEAQFVAHLVITYIYP
jgi:hypothetical protein